MCGLAGALSFGETDPDELARSVRALMPFIVRRGPDDEGLWGDSRYACAFRRLSILDLGPTGHQPMVAADGRHVLVFNGEIYNFRELRAELIALGRTFTSTGDAEVVLQAVAQWNTDALARMNGMFALAVYDRREHTLLLARDHAGIKPLHYAITPRGVVFGSQHDQVLAHEWFGEPRYDPDALALYLRLGFVPSPYGLHRGTGQLESGQWLEIDARGGTRRGYHVELPRWREPELVGEQAVEAFDAAFAAAIRRQLVADVEVGVLLSGGIDSPLVAAEARKQHSGALRAFTIEVDEPGLDESAEARRYAAELGVEHVTERVTAKDALDLVEDVTQAASEPTADYSMFPMLMVSRLARRHVKVVLSGDGGDELFWGYPDRFGPAIAQAPYFGLPRGGRFLAIAARRLGCGSATRDVVEQPSLGKLYLRKHTLVAERDLRAIFPQLPPLPEEFDRFTYDGRDRDHAAQWLRWNEFYVHLARVLAKVDRASMFHSLEVRVPLLDRDVIDVASRIDWRSCFELETRRGKNVLRRALARRVGFQTETKKGFSVPMQRWLAGPLWPLVRQHLLDRPSLCGIAIDSRAMSAYAERLRAGERSVTAGLWALLSLALWECRCT